jgi:WD40 repeat protein
LPHLFISHSSRDDLAAEAMRVHLVQRGWNHKEIFLDFSVEGISAHKRWKDSLGLANSEANALLCLASPDWLASRECQVERRVAETFKELDSQRSRAVLVAILRDLSLDQLLAAGFGEQQIVDLSAGGESKLIRASLPGHSGQPGRHDDVKFNSQALDKIEHALNLIGIAPEAFDWHPRDPNRPSPYPGLEAFAESDAGVFFGRERRLADALNIIGGLCRRVDSRILTIIAASGVGKSSFLRAGLWPRLSRQGLAPLVVLRPAAGIISGRDGGLIHSLSDWFRRAGRSVAPADLRKRFARRTIEEALSLVLGDAQQAAGEGRTLILGIDQAEELFDTSDEARAKEAMELFAALLALLARPPAGVQLFVILTIRADGYDSLAAALTQASDLAERGGAPCLAAIQETPLTLGPLATNAYRDVIRRPAQIALKTEREVFEPSLVDHLVDTSTGADALPLLAMTLEQLYAECAPRRQITRADYDALYGEHADTGPVGRALAEAYRMAGATAGTDETLKRLLIPALVTWDPIAGGGAARRRIAASTTLLDADSDLMRLADALTSPKVRLLTRGRAADSGATLEVAHEALLRVQPVRRWIEGFSAELRLRDEIEREASEWQNAETQLVAAKSLPSQSAQEIDAMQRRVDAAIAARRGPRLEAALELVGNPAFARLLGRRERAYLGACQANERAQKDKQDRTVGRAFVKPALQAVADGLNEHAVRLAAAGAVLANDLNLQLIPELWKPAARAIYENATVAVLKGHTEPVNCAAFSFDGSRVVTASDDQTARLWDAQTGQEIVVLSAHAGPVQNAAFSLDGARVVTSSSDMTARLWDAQTGNVIAVLQAHGGPVRSAAFSADGTRVVTASDDKTARLWDAHAGREIAVLRDHAGPVGSGAFSPDGTRVVTVSDDQVARLWDTGMATEIVLLQTHTGPVRSAAFSPDGTLLVTASDDHSARLWDTQTGEEIAVLGTHTGPVQSAAFSPDGTRVVTASSDMTARLWDAQIGEEIAVLKAHTGFVRSAAFSPDGARVVTASNDKTVRLWDAQTGGEIAVLRAHAGVVRSAAFSPNSMRVLTASDDQTARLWDASTRREIAVLQARVGAMKGAAFSPDGTRVVTASSDMIARLWNAQTGQEIVALQAHTGPVQSAAFSPDGTRVVTTSDDRTARLWDSQTGKEIVLFNSHGGPVRTAAFSPDGVRVVTASDDLTARIWDAQTGSEIALLQGHTGPVGSAAFSPDGTRVVTTSDDQTARLWEAHAGGKIAVLQAHAGAVQGATFSPNGTFVVTASDDRTARLWDTVTGKEIAQLQGHTGPVRSAAFSPDGARLVTASDDLTARLWDARTGRELAVLRAHAGAVQSATFSPDGTRVVTASDDQTARLWDARMGEEIALLEGHVGPIRSACVQPGWNAGGDSV